ncbi:putative dehydrogenase [Pseudarthrobacter phenanthrenivorans Sphe3]|uniref:Putative dehydrogenase n=1 Tax=Pseudarthrobacter phenanthrenivorans (strain DSM 18606 / JCM 16027 / LMG 23796 / Sphe3) TaxID=930171 RepID=F0M6C3_PSEPM|nr:Gfo/Idh/MocA family oxidoreductase [Pseudarthrobacter phenanthrenivorans]ADX71394.1 putative dehydrogenase [Pseudarthrobacter phenanthrenivorans Sphe3]
MTTLRVAMIGYGFMGAAHSQGWRTAPRVFDLPAEPEMAVIVGRNAEAVAAAAHKWGWAEAATDWREVITRDDIDVVDIVTPGDSHAEIAIAALEAGKHVLCEKPLANTVAEAEAMAEAAERAAACGVRAMVGFTYRRVPAVTFLRDLIAEGAVGTINQVRASYRQDWLVDPEMPLAWRLQKEHAGSGALGDIGAHAIDLAQFVTGLNLEKVSGTIDTIVRERPLLDSGSGLSGRAGSGYGKVTVDDIAIFTGRFESGALASFEASRFATGRKNALQIEVSGDKGALAFDLEDLNSVQFYDRTVPGDRQGFRKILVTEAVHPYVSAWWPAGHMLGYEHGFSHQVKDLVEGIVGGTDPHPTFADGLKVQRVLEAVGRSSENDSAWTRVAADVPAQVS